MLVLASEQAVSDAKDLRKCQELKGGNYIHNTFFFFFYKVDIAAVYSSPMRPVAVGDLSKSYSSFGAVRY